MDDEDTLVHDSSSADHWVSHLVLQHQDYLRALARQLAQKLPRSVSYDELVAAGQVGLIEAAREFDPAFGAAFTTFAYYRIRGAILDEVRRLDKWGSNARQQARREAAANDILEGHALADNTNPNQAAQSVRLTIRRLAAVFELADADSAETSDESPGESVENRELKASLKLALDGLDRGHMTIIRILYFEGRSMTQCAKELGCDKATVSRRHRDAIDALRSRLHGCSETG